MTLKPLTITDIPTLVSVARASYMQSYTHLWDDRGEKYMADCFNPAQIALEFSDSNAVFFLVFDAEKPVGFLKLNTDKAYENYTAQEALELERIYLLAETTGKGFGKQIIEFVMNLAKNSEKSVVWLKTMDTGPALEFYKKQNFSITGTLRLTFAGLKDELRGMYVMARKVSAE
jgi:diamine N-acetyltransferase